MRDYHYRLLWAWIEYIAVKSPYSTPLKLWSQVFMECKFNPHQHVTPQMPEPDARTAIQFISSYALASLQDLAPIQY